MLKDGVLIAAAQEERFTRLKHDPGFPANAVLYCLQSAGVTMGDIQYVVYYDKPLLTFERLLETYLSCAPHGFRSFVTAMPLWLKEKLYLKTILRKELRTIGKIRQKQLPQLLFTEHHQAHAASAFFASPFDNASVLCMDGVGEWAATSVWSGSSNRLTPLWQINFPHSLGLLYSAFTYFCGFRVNSGEYKLMGLAPYGEPRYVSTILEHLLDLKEDGTFRLNLRYFDFMTGLKMINRHFDQLFGGPPRTPESPMTQREMDIARSIQQVTEEIVLRLARTIHREQGGENLCLAGGVALNCVANGRLLREGPFKNIWIQPASGDAGGAVGAAFAAWYHYLGNNRQTGEEDAMSGALLGPDFSEEYICSYLDSIGAIYRRSPEEELLQKVSELLSQGKIVGWFQGRMEFGPRALGCRSILADARSSSMQSQLNLKTKQRESFRPFAPSILEEESADYFDLNVPSPYMLLVAPVAPEKQIPMTDSQKSLFGIEKLHVQRSVIPAVTHVDYSARIQTVNCKTNPRYYRLLQTFKKLTGTPLLINTSFNIRGEPIVCSPEDAYRCFMNTEIDFLVLENMLLDKKMQPVWKDTYRCLPD